MSKYIMKTIASQRTIYAGLITFVALILYVAANAGGAFPGESAAVMARALGASPFPPLNQPLWEGLSQVAGWLAPAPSVLAILSFACALFAAGSVGHAFSIGWILAEQRGLGRPMEARRSRSSKAAQEEAPRLVCASAGLWASVLLMLNLPVLIAATRPMPAAFDLWLLMFTVHRMAIASLSAQRKDHWLAALLMGLLAAENSASLPILAVAAVWMAWIVIRQELVVIPGITRTIQRGFNVSLIAVCSILFVAGVLAPLLIKAAVMRANPAGSWLGYTSYGNALWDLIVWGYRQYDTAWPSMGWLIMASVTAGPAALIAFVAGTADRHPVGRTLALLFLPVGIAGALALNTRATPWMLFGISPASIWPGAVLSLWGGALGALWARFSWIKWTIRERRFPAVARPVPALWRWGVAWGVPLALFSAAVTGTVREWTSVDTRGARVLREAAASIVKDVPPRTWILSSGWMDDLMALSAYEQRIMVRTLDLFRIHQPPVQRYLADAWKDNPLVSGLASFNIESALLEWLHGEGYSSAVIMDAPMIWSNAGLAASPEVWFYAGSRAVPTADEIIAGSASSLISMRKLKSLADRLQSLQPPIQQYGLVLRLMLSRIANDHAVHLISAKAPEHAKEWLQLAQSVCAENDIPSWNLVLLSASDEKRGGLAVELMELMEASDPAKRGFLAHGGWLSPQFSAIKESDLPAGRPSRPAALTPAQRIDLALRAGVTRSEESLNEFLASRQMLDDAVVSAANIINLMSAGNFKDAELSLDRLQQQYPTDPICSLTRLLLFALRMQSAEAARLEANLEVQKVALPATISVALAFMEIGKGLESQAIQRLEGVIHAYPTYVPAVEARLMLAVRMADKPEANRWAERLIGLDRGHPVALQVMSMIMAEKQRWNESEGLLRKALERGSRPDVLNDLAWTLAMSGRAQEAEPLIREALRQPAPKANFVDTLVEVLIRLDRKADAAKALDDGLKQWPSDPSLLKRKSEWDRRVSP